MFEDFRDNFKRLTVILCFGLIIRVVYVLVMTPNTIVFGDGVQYNEVAIDLLNGEGFPRGLTMYKSSRAPGYPVFISFIYLVFGTNILWVKLAQSLLNVLTILPIYGLGMMIFDKRVALTASFIIAIDSFFIFFTGLILSEILFMVFLSSSLCFLYIGIRDDRYFLLASGSLLMGLAILTRASLLLFPVFILVWIILEKRDNIKRALYSCVFFVIMVVLVLLPWSIRNYSIYHSFVPVTIGSGLTLYEGNNPVADGGPTGHKITHLPSSLTPLEQDRLYRAKALQFISEKPGRFLSLALVKFKRFWNIIPNYEEYRSVKYILISLLSYVPILVFGIIGIILSLTRDKKVLFLLLPVIYYTALHMIFPGSVRYRVPIMPFFMIISAYGFLKTVYKLVPFGR
jgi:4-amino-4-deoxy-L-arabinose transferase-like glycosyltransferase